MTFNIGAFSALLLAAPAGAAASLDVSIPRVSGLWACGPTVMKGADVTVTTTYIIERLPDMTFTTKATTQVEPDRRQAFTFNTFDRGTWRVDGATIVSTYVESTFISSSNPRVTTEIGQKIIDDEQRKKPVSASRVVHLDAKSMSTVSVKPLNPEAAVRSFCKRTQ